MPTFLQDLYPDGIISGNLLSSAVHAHERGKIIFIAAGKSYHAALLAVKLANSYSLRWFALDASHALHGDIGLVKPLDLLVYISVSGATREVLECARYLRKFDSVAISCNPGSPLEKEVSETLVLPLPHGERSLYGKAPMASSLAIISCLLDVINHIAELSTPFDVYLSSHPSGNIGESAYEI